ARLIEQKYRRRAGVRYKSDSRVLNQRLEALAEWTGDVNPQVEGRRRRDRVQGAAGLNGGYSERRRRRRQAEHDPAIDDLDAHQVVVVRELGRDHPGGGLVVDDEDVERDRTLHEPGGIGVGDQQGEWRADDAEYLETGDRRNRRRVADVAAEAALAVVACAQGSAKQGSPCNDSERTKCDSHFHTRAVTAVTEWCWRIIPGTCPAR